MWTRHSQSLCVLWWTVCVPASPPHLYVIVLFQKSNHIYIKWWGNDEVKTLTSLSVVKNTHFICPSFPTRTSMFKVEVVNVILHRYNRKSKTLIYFLVQMYWWTRKLLKHLLSYLYFLFFALLTLAGLHPPSWNSYSSRQVLFFTFFPSSVLSQTGDKEQKQQLKKPKSRRRSPHTVSDERLLTF